MIRWRSARSVGSGECAASLCTTPDRRPTARRVPFLWWMARGQWQTLVGGMCFGIGWNSAAQAVMPAVIGRAIDKGVAAKDGSALLTYAGVMLAIGILQASTGICVTVSRSRTG